MCATVLYSMHDPRRARAVVQAANGDGRLGRAAANQGGAGIIIIDSRRTRPPTHPGRWLGPHPCRRARLVATPQAELLDRRACAARCLESTSLLERRGGRWEVRGTLRRGWTRRGKAVPDTCAFVRAQPCPRPTSGRSRALSLAQALLFDAISALLEGSKALFRLRAPPVLVTTSAAITAITFHHGPAPARRTPSYNAGRPFPPENPPPVTLLPAPSTLPVRRLLGTFPRPTVARRSLLLLYIPAVSLDSLFALLGTWTLVPRHATPPLRTENSHYHPSSAASHACKIRRVTTALHRARNVGATVHTRRPRSADSRRYVVSLSVCHSARAPLSLFLRCVLPPFCRSRLLRSLRRGRRRVQPSLFCHAGQLTTRQPAVIPPKPIRSATFNPPAPPPTPPRLRS